MKVWAHTIVKNEERYIWFSIMSVIAFVDKVLVYDTGSTDRTVKIIKEIQKEYPNKIIFKEVGTVDIDRFTEIRQQMLDETNVDWVWILDADEVWWEGTARKHRELMNKNMESIVVKYRNMVGDIYHYQGESAGKYRIDGVEGHLTIRAMSMGIPGLRFAKPHGQQGVYDSNNTLIQDRNRAKRVHMSEIAYLHFTNLSRSASGDRLVPKRSFKYKYVLGKASPLDFYYPEVFFIKRPKVVPSPWERRSLKYEVRARIENPLRIIKKYMKFLEKSGY